MALFEKPWGNFALEGFIETTQPANISWFPQTIAWKILAIALIFYLLSKVYNLVKRYRHNRYRREALLCIEQLVQSNDPGFIVKNLPKLPLLLRKVALVAYPRKDISQLVLTDWETWLDSKCESSHFSTSFTGQLNQISYGENFTLENVIVKRQQANELINEVKHWIKNHASYFEMKNVDINTIDLGNHD